MADGRPAPVRLTRRGRLVVTSTVTALVLSVVALLGSSLSAARPQEVRDATGPTLGRPALGVSATPLALAPTPTPALPTPVPESDVVQAGTGELAVVPGTREPSTPDGRLVTYRVRVETGLTVAGEKVDGAAFADVVHAVLGDERGWQPVDGVRFRGVDDGPVDVEVVLASPDTTDRLCAPLGTGGWLSCYNGSAAVLNARRWFSGAEPYGDDLVGYRQYLVSHEVGHFLGHQHVDCPAPELPAPVMVQQTKSLYGCTKNPWPAGA